MFSAETYAGRRRRLSEQLGSGVVLITGNEESPMSYADNLYDFRQDSSFLYFFGVDAPHLAGVIDVDAGREIVFGDERTIDDVIWMGPQPPLREKCEAYGITETDAFGALGSFLQRQVGKGRTVHWLPQYRPENVLLLQQLLGTDPARARRGNSVPLIRAIVEQRSVKTPEELAEIELAVDISYEMQTTAMRRGGPGVIEQEVAGAMLGLVKSRGSRLAFPTILTVHGETLHNHHHHHVIRDGDLVLNDSGAESPLHYASDITRTFPASGEFSERQREVYSIVLDAQQAAIDAIRPGVAFRDVHVLACEVLASGLRDLGLMQGDAKQAVRAGAHAMFFQCGLGHQIGLDVHDMEALGEDHVGYTDEIRRNPMFGYRSLRMGRELEPGFVVTVEPGLYFIPELAEQWKAQGLHREFIDYDAFEAYREFGGIRIEDDVVVTSDGCRVLGSRPIPKSIDEVEAVASTSP